MTNDLTIYINLGMLLVSIVYLVKALWNRGNLSPYDVFFLAFFFLLARLFILIDSLTR